MPQSQSKGLTLDVQQSWITVVWLMVFGLVLLLFGTAIGYYFIPQLQRVSRNENTSASQQPYVPMIDNELPIDMNILLNRMVTQWRGSIQGRIIEKTETSFTMQDDSGNILNLTTRIPSGEKWNTIFLQKNGNEKRTLQLKDIDLNTKLNGEFWIFPGGKNAPVAGMFTLIE